MNASLLIAAGGGGDALAALLVHHVIGKSESGPPIVASFSWDRYILDPVPGPRTRRDFRGLRQITNLNWEIPASARLAAGQSSLALLARHTNARFVLLDPTNGVQGLRYQITELAEATNANEVTLVDVGGDVIAKGDERELLSPLADSMALAALNGLQVPGKVVIAGAGLDGELAESDVWKRCTNLGSWRAEGLSEQDVQPYLNALGKLPSEATTLLAASALGIRGKAEIRDRAALVTVDDNSRVLHVLNANEVISSNTIAQRVTDTSSLDEAEIVTASIHGTTELSHERRKAGAINRDGLILSRSELTARYEEYRERSKMRGVTLLTFRRLGEVIGLREYEPDLVRSIAGSDAHPQLALCRIAD